MSKVSHNELELKVGNPKVLEIYINDMEHRKPGDKSPLDIPPSSYSAQMSVVTDVVTDIDMNNDGYRDAVIGKAYRIGYGVATEPYRWVTFTSIYFGSAEHEYKAESAPLPSSKADITDAKIQDEKPSIDQWEASALLMTKGLDQMDRNVALAVHSLMTFCHNSLSYFEIVKIARKDLAIDAVEASGRLANEMAKQLVFSVSSVERAIKGESEAHYRNRLQNILRELDIYEEPDGRAEAYDMWTNPKNLKGDQLHDPLYQTLLQKVSAESKPEYEAEYLRNKAYFMEQQRDKGGLFEDGPDGFIARANEVARKIGKANYAEMVVKHDYNMSVADFKRLAVGILEKNLVPIKNAVEKMKTTMAPSRPVWELNMWYLFGDKMVEKLKKVGVEKEPTLSVGEALAVTKAFLKDMGCDLDHLPEGKKIVFDLYKRDKKSEGDFQLNNLDGSIDIISENYEADARLRITDLSLFMHEVGHAVHYLYGSRYAVGSRFGGAGASSSGLRETIANSFLQVALSRKFMDRYLEGYAEFKDARTRKILSDGYASRQIYWDSVIMARALWEIGLYEHADRPMDERLDYWGELGLKYLGYDDIGFKTSVTAFYSLSYFHPVYKPLQYLSYSIGMGLSNKMAASMLKDPKTFSRMIQLFEKSDSLFTVSDAEKIY